MRGFLSRHGSACGTFAHKCPVEQSGATACVVCGFVLGVLVEQLHVVAVDLEKLVGVVSSEAERTVRTGNVAVERGCLGVEPHVDGQPVPVPSDKRVSGLLCRRVASVSPRLVVPVWHGISSFRDSCCVGFSVACGACVCGLFASHIRDTRDTETQRQKELTWLTSDTPNTRT